MFIRYASIQKYAIMIHHRKAFNGAIFGESISAKRQIGDVQTTDINKNKPYIVRKCHD